MSQIKSQIAPIELRNVSFQYGTRNVLEDISFQVKPGAFIGLVGPNGSGKSTLMKIILGLLKPGQGEARLFGEKVSKFHKWDKVGFVSQKANSFNTGFPATVFEVVSMGLFGKVGLFRFLKKTHKEKVHQAIKSVGMEEYTYQNIGQLSGGQQQRVFIARALVSDPELLILDEPTVGVDVKNVQQFYSMLRHFNQERKMTLILVTHDIGAMSDYVTDVICLNKTIHFHGNSHEFASNPDLSSFYGHEVSMITHNHEHEEVHT
ncbi:metal ABC transporter ATP-binding protein [Alkalihalobacillus trypoxylicola]|uniref:Zinc ABC transporter ATP-binding protein n=1 Tax=Alkalihalobacillus trypoxylicola TaxID=519424 RepID=A0A162E8U1_9BACI|nr:metal ABC transporter ATP-binding protein [Alkalihalobacillus trypoxylicola]KYG32062.1 zinc ABC transporter ATP-binding protein [Alkalihalobacillus trypoxylicola]